MPASKPSRAAFTTATVAAAIALLAATIALAAAARAELPLRSSARTLETPVVQTFALQQLTPPPGAALLLIAGLVAARRGHR